jgi:hypothetical protein
MNALAALALTVLVLLAVSGAVTQMTKARRHLRNRRRTMARKVRVALRPKTVARTRRSATRKGHRR